MRIILFDRSAAWYGHICICPNERSVEVMMLIVWRGQGLSLQPYKQTWILISIPLAVAGKRRLRLIILRVEWRLEVDTGRSG